jgi:hypothetical protein
MTSVSRWASSCKVRRLGSGTTSNRQSPPPRAGQLVLSVGYLSIIPTMRLSTLSPAILSPELLKGLNGLGIWTEFDLLFPAIEGGKSGHLKHLLKSLPAGCIRLQELEQVYDAVSEFASAPVSTGWDSLHRISIIRRKVDLHSGMQALDELMDGFGGRRVLEIAGDKGSGKTVCYCSILMCILSYPVRRLTLSPALRHSLCISFSVILPLTQHLVCYGLTLLATSLERGFLEQSINTQRSKSLAYSTDCIYLWLSTLKQHNKCSIRWSSRSVNVTKPQVNLALMS